MERIDYFTFKLMRTNLNYRLTTPPLENIFLYLCTDYH